MNMLTLKAKLNIMLRNCALHGHVAAVGRLLAAGADVNAMARK